MKKVETSVACPRCKRSMSVTLAEVKAGYTKLCRNCGAQINLSEVDPGKMQNVTEQPDAPGLGSVEVKVKAKRPWWRFWSSE